MNPWHLRYFIEAARAGSLEAAAQKYNVTASAVSLAVRSLEDHLSLKLLSHKKRRFELTEAGERLAQKAVPVIADLDSLGAQLREDLKVWRGPLSFSAPSSLFVGRLWQSVVDIRRNNPDLTVNTKVGAAAVVRRQVLNGEVEFGVLVDDDQLGEFDHVPLFSGNFYLVGRKASLDATQAGVVVTEKSKIEVQHLMRDYKRVHKHNLRIDMELQSWTLIKNLARQVDVLGYVPDYVIEEELSKGQLHRLDQKLRPFKYEIKMIWNRGRPQPKGLSVLRETFLARA